MFAFNPPQFLIDFVAGVGPVFVVAMLGAVVTLVALIVLVPNARRLGLIDRPTERKRHDTPTPMVGGLAVFLVSRPRSASRPRSTTCSRSCWPRRFSS